MAGNFEFLCDLTRKLSSGQPIFSGPGDTYLTSESVRPYPPGGCNENLNGALSPNRLKDYICSLFHTQQLITSM